MPIAGQIKPVHVEDPADAIWREVGSLEGIHTLFQNVLIATYIRPAEAKTAGGIILTHQTVDEDRYQGKVGLVLQVGPRAFVDADDGGVPVRFYGYSAKPGDWVVFKPSEGMKMQIGKRECRVIADIYITKMSVDKPDAIY